MAPSSDPQAFREALASSKRVVILAGAGLSAASGIPTFRGTNGLWKTKDSKLFATPEEFNQDPSRIWQFYHCIRDRCLHAKPNAAHHALASLTLPSIRARLLPSLTDPTKPPLLITQNFDGLSPLALSPHLTPASQKLASSRLVETHGSILKTVCLQCKHTKHTRETPLCPAFAGLTEAEVEAGGRTIPVEELPRCGGTEWDGSNRYGRCGGLLRPAVVWFGEVPEGMGEIAMELNWTDLLIVVGTSSLVHPAASFAKTVKTRGGKVAVFNLQRSEGDENADFLFLGPCEETLPSVLGTTSES
ncbi:sirtuin [Rhodofomes roseus]|uniref:Sirtuin n=1 Tax=Rhodofomes roseus TaxID=34475 RepID=A0ABQ8KA68_9APHY|nr:sirtuin [Rhodofomes roseus]KAH9833780.1 sirtuin [Rhodofomes roseus]